MNLAVIPARLGSKRIAQKNIRHFCGRAVIEYSIDAAQSSGLFSQIVVSTDGPEIAKVAETCGATVLIRPSDLADDQTPLMPVVQHAIQALETGSDVVGSKIDFREIQFVCCLLATAPFVTSEDLRDSLQKLVAQPSADFVVPVTSFAYPIFRGMKVVADHLEMVWPQYEFTRSQDLPETFHDAGQFYWGSKSAWVNRDRIFSAHAFPYFLPRHRVQDLDTPEDWERAERMFQLERSELK